MPRSKKGANAPKQNTTADAGAKAAKRTRKPYPTREERIEMAEQKIKRLEQLNADREVLVAKTEEKLAARKNALEKSTQMLENAVSLRERLIAAQDRPARNAEMRAAKAAEMAQLDTLKAKLGEQGKTLEDLINEL